MSLLASLVVDDTVRHILVAVHKNCTIIAQADRISSLLLVVFRHMQKYRCPCSKVFPEIAVYRNPEILHWSFPVLEGVL